LWLAVLIVGLPNIGKSTLFNALTKTQLAEASNFPFCTIDPNVARVTIPDERLDTLAAIVGSQQVIHQSLELHDIAGLIKGASEGEGLGNKFLGHIRSVSVIIHVLRCFDGLDVHHVSRDAKGNTDPVDDAQVVETELMLSDLASVEKRLTKRKLDTETKDILERVRDCLAQGKPARDVLGVRKADEASDASKPSNPTENELRQSLLSAKPMLYVCNVDEDSIRNNGNELSNQVKSYLQEQENMLDPVVVCASLEEEALTLFEPDQEAEKQAYFEEYGLQKTGIHQISNAAASLLNLGVFYTAGPQEARAWSIPVPCTAQVAAGKIHTDIARGFIAADTISYEDFVLYKGEKGAKEAGRLRSEGREYIMQSGDVMNFKFNV